MSKIMLKKFSQFRRSQEKRERENDKLGRTLQNHQII